MSKGKFIEGSSSLDDRSGSIEVLILKGSELGKRTAESFDGIREDLSGGMLEGDGRLMTRASCNRLFDNFFSGSVDTLKSISNKACSIAFDSKVGN